MPDETINSLKQAFMTENDTIDECPMANQTTAFAFGELDSAETEKVQDHLKSCRYCLNLYIDIRAAEEEAKNVKDENVEVLPGLQKAIDKGKKPSVSSWQKISDAISGFLGGGFGLRPAVALATVCLVMFFSIYVLMDNQGSPYAIKINLQGRTQTDFRGGQAEYKEFQVKPGGELKSGDYFRFETTIDKDAYVYVIFQDSAGAIQSMEKGFVSGGKSFFLPGGDKWYRLDEKTGTEKIYMLASKDPIKDFSGRVEKLKSEGIDKVGKVFPGVSLRVFRFEHR